MVGPVDGMIEKYGLSPLPGEGGYFRFISAFGENSGCIYYLVTSESHSRAHMLDNDEVWFFLEGSDAVQLVCDPETGGVERRILNRNNRFSLVKRNLIQTTFLSGKGDYALFSTVMSPRYRQEDYHRAEPSWTGLFPVLEGHV